MEIFHHNPKQLHDYFFYAVALTSLCRKVFEEILNNIILLHIEGGIYAFQFTYQTGKCVEDAKRFILNCLSKHLQKKKLLLLSTDI